MLSEPGLIDVLKATWDILGPYVLLQKHTSEITSEDINLSKFILRNKRGVGKASKSICE